ncbi:regulator of G protein signaling superfamily, partial [Terfezia boudieri ATCC MYA-4762]
AQAPYCHRRPTLAEILSNQAPAPYTLSAFMAYLSQNHCLETLEFTMDASRYRKHFNSLHPSNGGSMTPDSDSCQYVRMLWQRLLDAYIAPNGPREVNLPSGIRENLLNIPNQQTPPPPESLDPAVNIIYELMEESVLMPFLNSYGSCQTNSAPWESQSSEDLFLRGSLDERGLRRKNNSGSPPPPQELSQSYSPTSSTSSRPRTISPFSTGLGWHRSSSHFPNSAEGPSANASGDSLANDDSMISSNTSASPMTPP